MDRIGTLESRYLLKSRKRKRKDPSKPFGYEKANARTDEFALSPADLLDSVQFLVGWINHQGKHHKRPAMPLYRSFLDIGRLLIGIELRKNNRWYLPKKWSHRLQWAGIEAKSGGGKWEIVNEKRFFLAIYQVITTGRFYISTQKRWLGLGAEPPMFELLYPKWKSAKNVSEAKERSEELVREHFSQEIISHLFD